MHLEAESLISFFINSRSFTRKTYFVWQLEMTRRFWKLVLQSSSLLRLYLFAPIKRLHNFAIHQYKRLKVLLLSQSSWQKEKLNFRITFSLFAPSMRYEKKSWSSKVNFPLWDTFNLVIPFPHSLSLALRFRYAKICIQNINSITFSRLL